MVKNIRASLEKFNYNPEPEWYKKDKSKFINKTLVVLDNGAEYTDEWNQEKQKELERCLDLGRRQHLRRLLEER